MVLSRLRRETSHQHQQVEQRLDLLSPQLNIDRYCRILQVMLAAFEPWEDELDSACPLRYSSLWSGRRRTPRLRADLSLLGSSPDPALSYASRVAGLNDEGLWLGSLYVIEGSALGGQVLSRHLERHFGWSRGRGYSYFCGYGANTHEKWCAVCDALEHSEADGNQIVAGAHRTFDSLISCFSAGL